MRILGPVDLQRSGLPVVGLSPRLRVVVALLAGHRGSVVSVDRMCDALWGDDQSEAAVATLQSHLSRVRRLVGGDGEIVAVGGGYRLDITDGEIDADRFEQLVGAARKAGPCSEAADLYRSALACWRGPAFGELAEEVWMRALAVRLDELRLTVTEEWVECRLAIGGDGSLTGDLEGLVASHPLRERFLRQLMVALYRDSRRAEALRRANQFRTLLRDDMGLDPSPAMLAVESQVLADDPVLVGGPVVSMPSAWRAIVDDPTRLVGRDVELARIADAIATAPLVTLVGPGGVGKTRLARRVAAVARGYDDGVAFVELAAVSDPASLPDALATALDVQQRHQLSIEESVLATLAERQQLVVFDNCEHLLDMLVPCVDNLRTRCPRLRVLATSREPLGLPGEVVVVIPPLSVDAVNIEDPEAVAESPAVELLIERVAATVPGFTITKANAAALGDICRRLDGLPLALELVAARFRSLDPATVLQRLDEPAVVLGTSMRSADPRHRTLRDTIAWSYAHLNSDEQMLFARLSTFAGSFDVESVEAVCGTPQGESATGAYVVDVLAALVDKSMVQLIDRGNTRYQLLETLRQYAREKLVEFGSADLIDAAHLRWFTEVAEQASVGLTGPDEAAWSRRIERDFDNYRVAHSRSVRTADIDAALRLVAGLREFAFRRIRYELITWATTCLTMPAAASHPKYPVAEAIVAYGHYVRGDLELSIAVGLQAVAHEHEGSHDSSGLPERALGNAHFYLGCTDEGLRWMDRMVTSARSGSPSRLAHALYMRSVGETSVGRTVQGAILAGEARATARASGSPTAQAQASYALGLALQGSEPLESLRLLRESAQLAGAAGNRWIEAFAQTEVWWLEARTGDVRTALAGSGRVIDTWHRGGDWANLRLSLRRVFGLLVQAGDHYGAAVLHGALNASGAISALPFEPGNADDLDCDVALLRDSLGKDNYDAAVEAGASLAQSALVTFVQERIAAQH